MSADQRDPAMYITILDGDVHGGGASAEGGESARRLRGSRRARGSTRIDAMGAAGDLEADITRDGVVSTQDVIAFLNAWVAGC